MLNHISIGVRDIARTKAFYDAALKPLGYKALSEAETSLGYGKDAVVLWISRTDAPVPADERSGLHFCFDAPTRESVAAFHKAALAAGGRDNGKAGLRPCARLHAHRAPQPGQLFDRLRRNGNPGLPVSLSRDRYRNH